jgi:hypothetical protein
VPRGRSHERRPDRALGVGSETAIHLLEGAVEAGYGDGPAHADHLDGRPTAPDAPRRAAVCSR